MQKIKPSREALFRFRGIPPLGLTVSMALQHLVSMIVGCVTPAIIIAGTLGLPQNQRVLLIQASLVMSAVTTLLELFPIGGRFGAGLPVIFGVSFAYLPSMLAIAADGGGLAAVAGAMIVGGVVATLVGVFIKPVRKLFPPVITGTVVFTIGLSLYPTAINYMAGGSGNTYESVVVERGLTEALVYGSWQNWAIAAFTLAVVLLLQLVVSPLLNRRVYTDDLVDGSGYPTFDVGMSALAGLYMPLGDYYGSYAEHSGFMRDTLHLTFYDRTGSNRFHIQTQTGLSLGRIGQLNSGDLHAIGYMYSGFFYDNRNPGRNNVWSGDTGQAALDALPEYMRLTSAVSFHKVLTVDELADIMARHPDVDFLSANVWVDGAYNYDSLHCSLQHMMLAYGDDLEEDYPGMQLQEYKNLTGGDITQHFRAMVQYLADHPEVAKAGPDEPYRYKEMLLNLEEDGLEVLGLWVQGTPDQITALLDEELVRSVRNYDARIQLWT